MSGGCCMTHGSEALELWVGGNLTGVIGLEQVFKGVLSLGPLDDESLAGELICRFMKNNYVPGSARADMQQLW